MVSVQVNNLYKKLAEPPLGGNIRKFLDYMSIEAGLSDNTILAYGRDLLGFAEFCTDDKTANISDIRPDNVYRYLHHLAGQGEKEQITKKSEASIKRALAAIKMLLKYGMLIGQVQDDFTSILDGPKLWQRLPIVCSKEKIMDLLNAPCPNDPYCERDKAILELLYATGCRASEAATLQASDVNFGVGYIRCIGKGNKERIIPLGQAAGHAIKHYIEHQRTELAKPKSDNNLFLSRTGKPMDRIDIWRVVKKYATRAGLPQKLTAHTIRHCFATHLLSGGADLRSVQEMLGHVDISTTQIYTHVDSERLRSIHKKFHPRG